MSTFCDITFQDTEAVRTLPGLLSRQPSRFGGVRPGHRIIYKIPPKHIALGGSTPQCRIGERAARRMSCFLSSMSS